MSAFRIEALKVVVLAWGLGGLLQWVGVSYGSRLIPGQGSSGSQLNLLVSEDGTVRVRETVHVPSPRTRWMDLQGNLIEPPTSRVKFLTNAWATTGVVRTRPVEYFGVSKRLKIVAYDDVRFEVWFVVRDHSPQKFYLEGFDTVSGRGLGYIGVNGGQATVPKLSEQISTRRGSPTETGVHAVDSQDCFCVTEDQHLIRISLSERSVQNVMSGVSDFAPYYVLSTGAYSQIVVRVADQILLLGSNGETIEASVSIPADLRKNRHFELWYVGTTETWIVQEFSEPGPPTYNVPVLRWLDSDGKEIRRAEVPALVSKHAPGQSPISLSPLPLAFVPTATQSVLGEYAVAATPLLTRVKLALDKHFVRHSIAAGMSLISFLLMWWQGRRRVDGKLFVWAAVACIFGITGYLAWRIVCRQIRPAPVNAAEPNGLELLIPAA